MGSILKAILSAAMSVGSKCFTCNPFNLLIALGLAGSFIGLAGLSIKLIGVDFKLEGLLGDWSSSTQKTSTVERQIDEIMLDLNARGIFVHLTKTFKSKVLH